MDDWKQDMTRIQELVGAAFGQTGTLVALTDGGQMNPNKLQKTLEQTMDYFERSTLELRRLCERNATGIGGFARKNVLAPIEVSGYVEQFGYGWLHVTLNTLLPHCRYQSPNWLSDTISRLLDAYESGGKKLPFYKRALLVIDEHSAISGRHIFDQDNKGWKAVSNAIKERLIPDDDQYTLSVALLSTKVKDEDRCHITLLDLTDAADFFPSTPAIMSLPTSMAADGIKGKSSKKLRKHPTDDLSILAVFGYGQAEGYLLGVCACQCLENTDFLSGGCGPFCPAHLPTMGGNRLPSHSEAQRRRNCSCAGTGARAVSASAGNGKGVQFVCSSAYEMWMLCACSAGVRIFCRRI